MPDTIFAKPVHEPDQAANVNKDHDVYASWMINKIHVAMRTTHENTNHTQKRFMADK